MSISRISSRLSAALLPVFACLCLSACMGNYTGSSSSGGGTLADRVASGLSIRAERGSKTLDISRVLPGGRRPSGIEENGWTVFVYLCGSDLETKGGAATNDLNEMVRATGSSKVRFVVETGGANRWHNRTVSNKKLGRYLIQNGTIKDAGTVRAANMGMSSTLSDFLTWGVKTYPADHMGLILWDHGGGSIAGACFDEPNSSDSLYLREVDEALAATYQTMWEKFEFIGFDACLMSTLETANVLASYADYMIASQESEPATGWEYGSIIEYLAKHPSCTGNELGKSVCNSYLKSVDSSTRGFTTLSVVDLSQIDQLMQDFYRFSQEMYASGDDQGTLAAMSRGIQRAENYGCNNHREGYTNMVDLGGIVEACAEVTPSAQDVLQTLNKAVTYQIRGTYHAAASGLSTYYPLSLNTSKELSIFQTVAVNPSYLSYVDRLAHGATYNGGTPYTQYSGDTFFDENAFWNWLLGNAQETQQQVEDHWEYVDDHNETSTQVTFAQEPEVDDQGTYWFVFDQHGINNASVVSGLVYMVSEDGTDHIALGETYDVYGDWETGQFSDGFNGHWLSLPDGQSLNLAVESATEDYIVYTSPITLNGTSCYLRMQQNIKSGKVTVEGAWNGVGANGAIDRGVTTIKRGDVIVPQYDAVAANDDQATSHYEGEPYTVTSKRLNVSYDVLPDGAYLYRFCIKDSFGDSFLTKTARFEIDPDGTIYFE